MFHEITTFLWRTLGLRFSLLVLCIPATSRDSRVMCVDIVVPWSPHRCQMHDALAPPQQLRDNLVISQVRFVKREPRCLVFRQAREDVGEVCNIDTDNGVSLCEGLQDNP